MTDQVGLVLDIYVAIFVIAGLVTILIGLYGKVTPFIGLRIGYAYVSKKLWRKYNIVTGIALIIYALILYIISMWFNNILLIMISPLPYLAILLILVFMAEREAERESLKTPQETREIEFRKGFRTAVPAIIISLIAYVFSITYMVLSYPLLPDRVASHFGPGGQPNGFMTKDALLLTSILAILVLVGVTFSLAYLGLRKPEAFYRPYMKWDATVKTVDAMFVFLAYINVVVSLALVDTVYYNLQGHHILPSGVAVYLFVLPLIVFLAISFYYVAKGYQKSHLP